MGGNQEEQMVAHIKIVVKTQDRNEEFIIEESKTIGDLKLLASSRFDVCITQLCMIYAGRVLADLDVIREIPVMNGNAVHLVIRQPGPPLLPPRYENCVLENIAAVNSQHTRLDNGFSHVPHEHFEDIAGNILNNREYMEELLRIEPQIQAYLQSNPEIINIIQNPSLMRRYLTDFWTSNGQDPLQDVDSGIRNLSSNVPDERGINIQRNTAPASPLNVTTNIIDSDSNLSPNNNPWAEEESAQFLSPDLVTQMLNNSHVQQLMQDIAADSNFLQTVVDSTPNLDPNLRDYLRDSLPAVIQNIQAMENSNGLRDFMNQMSQQRPPPQIQPPTVRYSNQLEQLQRMGFTDPVANLRALVRTFGNLNGAVAILTREQR